MSSVRTAAIYARISRDQDGAKLGVGRQLKDCRKLAAELGWEVAEEYVDNDVSAYSGKRRPAYERMLEDITAGLRDAVVVYHVDRLARRPIEMEQFVSTVDAAKVRHVRFVSGGADLSNADGLLVVRMMAAVAANESAAKSRRIRRKIEENVAAGKPNGGANRPFGYERDRVTVREDEAEVYRTLVARYLAGESLRSLTVWLEQESATSSTTGSGWRSTTVRGMLANPRYAGLRAHNGDVAGTAVWPAIVTLQTHQRVLGRMAERAASGRRASQRYLLTGMLRCGKCGNPLFSSRRENSRRYVCLSGPDHGGCGRLTVVADPLERFVADAVLLRLDTRVMADALSGRRARDAQAATLDARLSDDKAQLEELAGAYGRKDIGLREWMAARKPIEDRIRDTERRLSRAAHSDALDGLAGTGEQLRAQWASIGLDRQQAIVRAVLDHAVILPGTPGARSLNIDRVKPEWRRL